MEIIDRRVEKLAIEAVDLVNDIKKKAEFLGNDFIEGLKLNSCKDTILVKCKGKIVEYSLSEASYIFSDSVYEFWKNELSFFDMLKQEEENISQKYDDLGKEEFINYIDNLYDLKYTSNYVLKRLKEIEGQA